MPWGVIIIGGLIVLALDRGGELIEDAGQAVDRSAGGLVPLAALGLAAYVVLRK